jgi:hypothetical protein
MWSLRTRMLPRVRYLTAEPSSWYTSLWHFIAWLLEFSICAFGRKWDCALFWFSRLCCTLTTYSSIRLRCLPGWVFKMCFVLSPIWTAVYSLTSNPVTRNLLLDICLFLDSPLWGLGRFFSILFLYTIGKTPWTVDQPVARPLPTHRTT